MYETRHTLESHEQKLYSESLELFDKTKALKKNMLKPFIITYVDYKAKLMSSLANKYQAWYYTTQMYGETSVQPYLIGSMETQRPT